MALADDFEIAVHGRGGHAAMPFLARDPIAPAMALAQAINALATRAAPGTQPVVGVTCFNAGEASNVIPETALLKGTIRTLDAAQHRTLADEVSRLCAHLAAAFEVEIAWRPAEIVYPPTLNDPAATALATRALKAAQPAPALVQDLPPIMGAEDFAFIANALPSAFLFVGNGASAPLHHPAFDFDDDAAIWGARYWRAVVETTLPLETAPDSQASLTKCNS
jgi:hippurate hydrolase